MFAFLKVVLLLLVRVGQSQEEGEENLSPVTLSEQCSNDLDALSSNKDYQDAKRRFESANKECLSDFDHTFCNENITPFVDVCHNLDGTVCSRRLSFEGDENNQVSFGCIPNFCTFTDSDLAELGEELVDNTHPQCDENSCRADFCFLRLTGKPIFSGGTFHTNRRDLTIGVEFNQPIRCNVAKAELQCDCFDDLDIHFPFICQSDDTSARITFSMLNVVPFALGEDLNMTISRLVDQFGHPLQDINQSFKVQDFDHSSAVANIAINISVHLADDDFITVWSHALAAELEIESRRINVVSVTYPEIVEEFEENNENFFILDFMEEGLIEEESNAEDDVPERRIATITFQILCGHCDGKEMSSVDVAQNLVLKFFPKTTLSEDVNELLRMPQFPNIRVNVVEGSTSITPEQREITLTLVVMIVIGGMLVLICIVWRYNATCQKETVEPEEPVGLMPQDLPATYVDDNASTWNVMTEPLLEVDGKQRGTLGTQSFISEHPSLEQSSYTLSSNRNSSSDVTGEYARQLRMKREKVYSCSA